MYNPDLRYSAAIRKPTDRRRVCRLFGDFPRSTPEYAARPHLRLEQQSPGAILPSKVSYLRESMFVARPCLQKYCKDLSALPADVRLLPEYNRPRLPECPVRSKERANRGSSSRRYRCGLFDNVRFRR